MANNGIRGKVFPFPAVTFSLQKDETMFAYFNKAAVPLFDGYECIDALKTSEHIIFATNGRIGTGSVRIRGRRKGEIRIYSAAFANYPLSGKTYRLYRCAQGYAIRIYEPIHERERKS